MNFLLGSELQVLAASSIACRRCTGSGATSRSPASRRRSRRRRVLPRLPHLRRRAGRVGRGQQRHRPPRSAPRAGAAPTRETTLFDFLEAVLTGTLADDAGSGARREVLRFAQRFQQYTGPVMAKAVEDTSFYRQPALLALNEVGETRGGPPCRSRRFMPRTWSACAAGRTRWSRPPRTTRSAARTFGHAWLPWPSSPRRSAGECGAGWRRTGAGVAPSRAGQRRGRRTNTSSTRPCSAAGRWS